MVFAILPHFSLDFQSVCARLVQESGRGGDLSFRVAAIPAAYIFGKDLLWTL